MTISAIKPPEYYIEYVSTEYGPWRVYSREGRDGGWNLIKCLGVFDSITAAGDLLKAFDKSIKKKEEE